MIRNESDTAWKEILDAYFKYFVEYCMPKLYVLVDWTKRWDSLDKELNAITKGADAGKKLLDKLFMVFLQDGGEQWVLVHLEIQGKQDDDFPRRMFIYGYRIYDRYQKPVVSCAILTDETLAWRPASYSVGLVDSYLSVKYLVIKLIDYKDKSDALEVSSNPFASVILAQLAALAVKRKPDEERKQMKFVLTRKLYEKGFKKTDVINLYKFIDWLIGLSNSLELEYLREVHELEEVNKMPYISSAEKFGIEQGVKLGLEQGLEQGLKQGAENTRLAKLAIAKRLLEEGIDLAIIEKATGLSLARIKELQQALETVEA